MDLKVIVTSIVGLFLATNVWAQTNDACISGIPKVLTRHCEPEPCMPQIWSGCDFTYLYFQMFDRSGRKVAEIVQDSMASIEPINAFFNNGMNLMPLRNKTCYYSIWYETTAGERDTILNNITILWW